MTKKQKIIEAILSKLRERHGDNLDYAKKRRLLERNTLKNISIVLADIEKTGRV